MIMRSKIIVSIAFLCMFFLTGSASAAVDFPADEAGISVYVKAKDVIDLDDAKSAFVSIERETADYIIGTVELAQHTEEQYPHVYVSTDGWVVAYYPKDRESSWILPWADYAGGPISSTTLSKAVGIVATAVGGSSNGIKYYDFRYPDATKMMFILESIDATGSNSFKVTIPSNFHTYVVDWSLNAGPGTSYVYLDNVLITSASATSKYGHFIGQFDSGIEHSILLTATHPTSYASYVGLVLEYAE